MKNYRHAPSAKVDYPNKIAIIGAGVSGLVTAYNLRKDGYDGDISLFEMNASSGGRLMSQKVENDDMVMEFGAGRLHKIRHKKLYNLCMELGLAIIPFNYAAHFQETGSINAIESFAHTDFKSIFLTLRDAVPSYAGQKISFAQFCTKTLGQNILQQLQLQSGYDALSNPNLPAEAGLCILENHPESQSLFYGNMDNWFCIKDGFQRLTHILESRLKNTISMHYQSQLKRIGLLSSEVLIKGSEEFRFETRSGGYSLTFETPVGRFTTNADVVIAAMPLLSIKNIAGWSEVVHDNLSQEIEAIPLIKGFIQFSRPWWKDFNLTNTCLIADTPFRKLYFSESSNAFWFYSDSASAVQAKELMEREGDFPRALLEKHIGYKIPADTTLIKCGWKFWERGVNFFKVKSMKNAKDFSEVAKNLLICSDIFTNHLGWIEGCLTSSDAIIRHLRSRYTQLNMSIATPANFHLFAGQLAFNPPPKVAQPLCE